MLVINRKSNESIIIGDNIEIIISEIDGDRVKVCIDAPKEISIVRKELLEAREVNKQSDNKLSENMKNLKALAANFKKKKEV